VNNMYQEQLGNKLWKIADDLRLAMNADDFRDDMLSFRFLRYCWTKSSTRPEKD